MQKAGQKSQVVADNQSGSNSLPSRMRASGFHRYGPAEVMELLEVDVPALTPDAVLIRVVAAGINPADWRIRSGQFKMFMRAKMPFVPGSDAAGIVVAVGSEVTRFRPGEAVFVLLPTMAGGGYAEYVVAKEKLTARMPHKASFVEAAGVPLTGLTALQALRDQGGLLAGSGKHILINGASGGVGSFAVQIARAMGAQVTARTSQQNAELVRSLGAEEVLDYNQPGLTKSTDSYDIVFDAVNKLSFKEVSPVLKPSGTFVSVNPFMANPFSKFMAGLSGGKKLGSVVVKPSSTDLEMLANWLDTGQVRPVIDRKYPLAEVSEAHRYSETERVRGKLVLVIDEQLAGQTHP